VAADFHTAHFEGRAIFGTLDNVVMDSRRTASAARSPQRYYRYIVGHELTWRPSRWPRSRWEDRVAVQGAQTVDLSLVNPFIPYVISQHDTGRRGTRCSTT